MAWFTLLTGIIIFAIGAWCRFVIHLMEWQVMLPIVFGLGYITLAEGMRSKPALRRLFLFLSILWSVVVLISMIPVAREGIALWNAGGGEPPRLRFKSELVMEHVAVLVVSGVYLLLAVIVLFRHKPNATPASPENAPKSPR